MVAKRPKLGSHLEWHGNRIRVVIRVPPSLVTRIGSNKLKEPLPTSSPREAELLKWPVIQRLKASLGKETEGTARDPLVVEALSWREALRDEREQVDAGELPRDASYAQTALELALDRMEAEKVRQDRIDLFTSVATGVATPLLQFVDEWIADRSYTGRTEASHRASLRSLEVWCKEANERVTLESFDRKKAQRFVKDRFHKPAAHPATARRIMGGIRLHWQWLMENDHLPHLSENPWKGIAVDDKAASRRAKAAGIEDGEKRPFTDNEVTKLLDGITDQPLADFIRVAALTGMRREEIATLKVSDIRDGVIHVRGTKTDAARRKVPVHPDLVAIVDRRSTEKEASAYLFDELPEQTNAARGRGSPITQTFTRRRRALGVDDRAEGVRQSRIDLHSFRRWFIRKAVEAIETGASGFTAWTIADVVGHSKEDGPLAMTMGRYPGKANEVALRACVEAVKLPEGGTPGTPATA